MACRAAAIQPAPASFETGRRQRLVHRSHRSGGADLMQQGQQIMALVKVGLGGREVAGDAQTLLRFRAQTAAPGLPGFLE